MNFLKQLFTNKYNEIITLNITILLIALSSVSNTTIYFQLAKILIISIGFLLVNNNKTTSINHLTDLKLYIVLLIVSLLSLLYTNNTAYGLQKATNLFLNIPILVLIKIQYESLNENKVKIALQSLALFSVISFILVLLLNPFDQSKEYTFTITRWSHVIFSRAMSLIYLIFLIILIYSNNKKHLILLTVLLIISSFQIYLANLRAASIGIIGFSLIIILFSLIKKQLDNRKIIYLLTSFLILILSIIYYPTSDYFNKRYGESATIAKGIVPQNSGISVRLTTYEKSVDIINENKIFGTGIGGFRNYNNDKFLDFIKYPHNIFLEFQVELGIFGTLFFLLFLYKTWRILYVKNIYLLFVWLFTIWLALFAKDIASNLLVFIPLVLYDNNIRSRN